MLSKYLVRRKLLTIDPFYLLAGPFNVLMLSRAGQFVERVQGKPTGSLTTNWLSHHGQDISTLTKMPAWPKAWSSHFLLATPNEKLSENVSFLILSKSTFCVTGSCQCDL